MCIRDRVMTWTKSRTQRLGERIAAIIAASAAAAATMYQGRSGAATRAGGAAIIVSATPRSRYRTVATLATRAPDAKPALRGPGGEAQPMAGYSAGCCVVAYSRAELCPRS